jgi:hypothetical protein
VTATDITSCRGQTVLKIFEKGMHGGHSKQERPSITWMVLGVNHAPGLKHAFGRPEEIYSGPQCIWLIGGWCGKGGNVLGAKVEYA